MESGKVVRIAKYTQKQRDEAVALYTEVGSATAMVRRLEYPTRQQLYKWVSRNDQQSHLPAPGLDRRCARMSQHIRFLRPDVTTNTVFALFPEENPASL